jgi:type I restriction enzyme S subunit
MTNLNHLIAELCPNGVEYKTLGEIATEMYRGSGITRDQVTAAGTPCVRYGEIYTTYNIWFNDCVSHTDEKVIPNKKYFEHGDVLFAITGESVEEIAKSCVYIGNGKCLAGGDLVVMKHNQDPKYLAYALSTTESQQQKSKGKVKSKVVHSSVPALEGIIIPLPPLPVQREIVQILDNFTELTAELTARKTQYEYYRKRILNFGNDVKLMTLGEIGRVAMCKRIMKAETASEGDVPFYKIGTFGKTADAYISAGTYERYKRDYSFPKRGDILISAAGTIGRAVIYDGEPAYYQDSNIVWLEHNENQALNKYLFYCYQLSPWHVSTGGTIARLYNDNISKAKIPLPSLKEQARIVAILDRFDTLTSDITSGLPVEIEARRKQYEYYRDKLMTFKEKQFDETAYRVYTVSSEEFRTVEGDS